MCCSIAYHHYFKSIILSLHAYHITIYKCDGIEYQQHPLSINTFINQYYNWISIHIHICIFIHLIYHTHLLMYVSSNIYFISISEHSYTLYYCTRLIYTIHQTNIYINVNTHSYSLIILINKWMDEDWISLISSMNEWMKDRLSWMREYTYNNISSSYKHPFDDIFCICICLYLYCFILFIYLLMHHTIITCFFSIIIIAHACYHICSIELIHSWI